MKKIFGNRFLKIIFLSVLSSIILSFISYNIDSPKFFSVYGDQGTLDLTDTDFNTRSLVTLAGGYEIYENLLLDPTTINSSIPTSYGNATDSFSTDDVICATYHLTLELAPCEKMITFYSPCLGTASRVYINGKLIHISSDVSSPTHTWFSKYNTFSYSTYGDNSTIDMIIQVKNDIPSYSDGMINSILLGNSATIDRITNTRTFIFAALIMFFLLVGLNSVITGINNRSNNAELYFGIVCFAATLTLLFQNNGVIVPFYGYLSNVCFSPMAVSTEMVFILAFLGETFAQDIINTKKILSIYFTFMVIWIVATIFGELISNILFFFGLAYIFLLCGYVSIALVRAVNNKVKFANIFLFCFTVVGISTAIFSCIPGFESLYFPSNAISSTFLVCCYEFILFSNYLSGFRSKSETSEMLSRLVEKRTEDLIEANRKLVEMERSRTKIFENISHDLRSPITAINNAVEYLSLHKVETIEEEDKLFRLIKTRTHHLENLINDLFLLSSLENRTAKFTFTPVEIGAVLEEFYFSCDADPKFSKMHLDLAVPVNYPVKVNVDVNRIIQVLDNFFGNAVKYSDEGSTITLGIYLKSREVVIYVKDTGHGIPKDSVPHVFERSYTVSQARTPGVSSNGLGLSIARHIVERHGGSIWCESVLSEGSTFSFSLPVYDE